jgi:hypothetical protein
MLGSRFLITCQINVLSYRLLLLPKALTLIYLSISEDGFTGSPPAGLPQLVSISYKGAPWNSWADDNKGKSLCPP